MAFSEAQIALSNRIWAQVHAERRAASVAAMPRNRQRDPAFIGPVDRLEMFRRAAKRKHLAAAARAHLLAGGCSGDFCPSCNGTGEAYELYDHGKATACACFHCNGKGMGK